MIRQINILTIAVMLLGMAVAVVSCSNDDDLYGSTVQYGVAMGWHRGVVSRAFSTNTPDPENAPITKVWVEATPVKGGDPVTTTIYPDTIDTDDDTPEYEQYHTSDPDGIFGGRIELVNIANYTYLAKAMSPEPSGTTYAEEPWTEENIPSIGTTDYLLAQNVDKTDSNVIIKSPHVLFTLHHQTAMMRLFLGVSNAYNSVRTFQLTALRIYDGDETADKLIASATIADGGETVPVMKTTISFDPVLSFYLKPDATVSSKQVRVVATYDVYDKKGQKTRSACKASNILNLNPTQVAMGYYYDIIVTLAPDFLYVLSDNDQPASDLELK